MGSIAKTQTIIKNARIFTSVPGQDKLLNGSLILEDGLISYVGDDSSHEIAAARSASAEEVDVQGHVVTSSFIDSHVHIMHFGQSLAKLNILPCKSLDEIRSSIKAYAAANPDVPRILCRGWFQASVEGRALASMLDDLDPRPVYCEAMDLHSVWCNTAALTETGIMGMAEDPAGGKIHRDDTGKPSGLLEESALHAIVIPFLTNVLTTADKQDLLHQAFTAYTAAGYTGVIDMAMDAEQWEALVLYRQTHTLPIHIAAHWLIPYSESDDEINTHLSTAITMHQRHHPSTSPDFCIVGIKIVGDGTIDGCTAAMSLPYGHLAAPCLPIWPHHQLRTLIHAASAAGLQIAVHAIGDATITSAIDCIASLPPQPTPPRHRIEHLELASAADAARLGQLGITASVQPVHSDPVLFRAMPHLLGSHACKRAFAYSEFRDGGAVLAFGTDAPTAAHLPLPNLYNATTRRSALEVGDEARTNPEFAVSLVEALRGVTSGAAYSRFAEGWAGSLEVGKRADFVVLETDWTAEGLLGSRVRETWCRGERVWCIEEGARGKAGLD